MVGTLEGRAYDDARLTDAEWEKRFSAMLKAQAYGRGAVFKEREEWIAFSRSGRIRMCFTWAGAMNWANSRT